MPQDTNAAYLGAPRRLSAATGTVINTTRAHIAIPAGIRNIVATPNTFVTGVVAQISLNPFIHIIKTTDAMATNPTDYAEQAQDGATGTLVTFSSQPTLANGGAIYVGAVIPFGGMNIIVVNGSGGAGAMAVTYWDGTTWSNITPTDGTTNMNASGDITWAIPAASTPWIAAPLQQILGLGLPRGPIPSGDLYWVRIATSAAYDATTTLSAMYSISQYANAVTELPTGVPFPTEVIRPFNGGNLQAIMNAGTGLLLVNGYMGAQ